MLRDSSVPPGTRPGGVAWDDLAEALRRRIAAIRPHYRPTADYARGAVMLVLYPVGAELRVPMIERPTTMPQHAGQISLPGGGVKGDESTLDAAKRETEEEIGIERGAIEHLGSLGHFPIPVTSWDVEAHVGLWGGGMLMPDPNEVVRALSVPFDSLIEQHAVSYAGVRFEPTEYPTYHEPDRGDRIWGATARILHYFIDTIYQPALG